MLELVCVLKELDYPQVFFLPTVFQSILVILKKQTNTKNTIL